MPADSPLVRLVDFIDEIVSGGKKQKENSMVVVWYTTMFSMVLYIWHHHSDKDFSFILTVSQMLQTFAFFLLLHKVRVTKSVAGISSKTLQIYVLVFMFRLSSTMVKNGYLPVDSTGDWVYQGADMASMMLCFQLLFFTHKRYKDTYQSELDSLPMMNLVPAAILAGVCLHGNLNHSPLFDKAWAIGMWLDTVAMLPQLWMLVAKGGEVEALTANYIGMTFISKAFAFFFWYTGYPELAPANGGFNMVGCIIMTAHSLQLLFSADFMYHYFAWQANNGCAAGCGATSNNMVLPVSGMMDI